MSKLKLSKEEALAKIEELKQYVDEVDNKVEEPIGIAIKSRYDESTIVYQSTKATIKEAVEEAVPGGADLNGADLHDSNLSGANLRYSNLRDADLCDADLRGADLHGANLHGADLCGADLRGANLSGADLHGAELQSVKFFGKGGGRELKRSQLVDFLHALGFNIIED